MRAAVLTKLNSPLEVRDVELTPLQYGQVQVRMIASGICGAQLQEIRGEKGNAKHLPHLLGHEGCGRVEAVGLGVTRVKAGDKVVIHWRKSDGIESPFPQYVIKDLSGYPAGVLISSGKCTTFSEQTIVSENRVTPVADDVPVELCSLLGCGLSTALGTIENDANLRFGETILIVGCGGLGVNLIRAAKMRQASRIVVVDVNVSKADLAKEMGAEFWSFCQVGHRFDVIVCTAGGEAMQDALPLLAPDGRFIIVGQARPGESVSIVNAAHLFEGQGKRIIATQGGQFKPHEDIPRYVKMWRAGLLRTDGLVTHRVPLEHINAGIAYVRAGQAGRVLVEFSD